MKDAQLNQASPNFGLMEVGAIVFEDGFPVVKRYPMSNQFKAIKDTETALLDELTSLQRQIKERKADKSRQERILALRKQVEDARLELSKL